MIESVEDAFSEIQDAIDVINQNFSDLDKRVKALEGGGTATEQRLGEAIIDPSGEKPFDLRKEIEAVIPEPQVYRSWSFGPQRLIQDLKRVLRESQSSQDRSK